MEDPAKEELAIQESIEIKKVAGNTSLENIDLPTKNDIIYSNVPLIYMKNFLLVDYSKLYITPPTFEKIELTGTSAALENKEDTLGELHENNIQTITISYKDYLRETQEKLEANDFKSALKRYKTILSKYPDDLNAHFYSGFCYFNIGQYDLAIQHFKVAKNHPYNTFSIDAEWYMAKTFCHQGKTTSCKMLLEQIIQGGQFYKPQAEELLKKL
jgi:tetratricopeptide (TPR) repeat protein